MSGHSKWAQIKRQKAVADKKKGNIFTKLGNAIAIAAKQSGPDPAMNFKLRMAIEKAKTANMPNDNIERAIKKGGGGTAGAALEEVIYEGFGPGGTAIIVEATTDNKNRATSEIRNIFAKHQGNLAAGGSVNYLFGKKGAIRILKNQAGNKEEFELKLIDAGAEDIIEEDEGFTIYTSPAKISAVKDYLERAGLSVASADLELVPQNKVAITDSTKEKLSQLLEELEAVDDVINYYTNAII